MSVSQLTPLCVMCVRECMCVCVRVSESVPKYFCMEKPTTHSFPTLQSSGALAAGRFLSCMHMHTHTHTHTLTLCLAPAGAVGTQGIHWCKGTVERQTEPDGVSQNGELERKTMPETHLPGNHLQVQTMILAKGC